MLPLNGSIKYCPNFVRVKELYLACDQPPMDKEPRFRRRPLLDHLESLGRVLGFFLDEWDLKIRINELYSKEEQSPFCLCVTGPTRLEAAWP